MAQSNETSWYGASMAVKTISIKTNAALGTLAEAMLAAVEVNLKEKYFLLRLPVQFKKQSSDSFSNVL